MIQQSHFQRQVLIVLLEILIDKFQSQATKVVL